MSKEPGERDPREQEPKTPYPEQEQPQPGKAGEMRPRSGHGEETYRGTGKLQYASTQCTILTFTHALAEMGARQWIRVNGAAPGPVWTPLIPASLEAGHVKEFGADTLIGRPAQPAELAPAYVYLASQDSSYVTGAIMDLTGGRMLP